MTVTFALICFCSEFPLCIYNAWSLFFTVVYDNFIFDDI